MTRIVIEKEIDASLNLVFSTVADIEQFSKVIPHIVKFEILSDGKYGVGSRFSETRLMNGKESVTEYSLLYSYNQGATEYAETFYDELHKNRLKLQPIETLNKL